MEAIISDLVTRFEKGALSRRGLIQGPPECSADYGRITWKSILAPSAFGGMFPWLE